MPMMLANMASWMSEIILLCLVFGASLKLEQVSVIKTIFGKTGGVHS